MTVNFDEADARSAVYRVYGCLHPENVLLVDSWLPPDGLITCSQKSYVYTSSQRSYVYTSRCAGVRVYISVFFWVSSDYRNGADVFLSLQKPSVCSSWGCLRNLSLDRVELDRGLAIKCKTSLDQAKLMSMVLL
jgi:hypothetical protein